MSSFETILDIDYGIFLYVNFKLLPSDSIISFSIGTRYKIEFFSRSYLLNFVCLIKKYREEESNGNMVINEIGLRQSDLLSLQAYLTLR